MKDPVVKKLDLGNSPKKTKKSRIEDDELTSDEEYPRRSAGKRRRAFFESDSDDEKKSKPNPTSQENNDEQNLSQKLSELCSQEINSDAEFESDEVTYDAAADNTALKRKKEKIEASPEPQKSYEEKALEEYERFRKNRRKVDENYVVYCYHDEHNNVFIQILSTKESFVVSRLCRKLLKSAS